MINRQRQRIRRGQGTIQQQRKRDPQLPHRLVKAPPMPLLPQHDMRDRQRQDIQRQQRRRRDKRKKVPVVAAPDAVVQPHAVVVLRLDAVVAHAAVVAARRPPDAACAAVFHGDLDGDQVFRGRADARPGVGGGDGEGVVGVVAFEGV